MATAEIHPANLAGTWYPADPGELREQVEDLLGDDRTAAGDLRAVIAPHAGYRYSGRAAGAAFARIGRGRWRRAVVVAPSHYHAFAGAALFPGTGFATPLGVVPVDREGVRTLAQFRIASLDSRPYDREHSLEIELPFLQIVDRAMAIVPVLVGSADDPRELSELGEALRTLDDGNTLFVVSSDFTHYGASFDYLPFPPSDAQSVSRALRELDFGAIGLVVDGDADRFVDYVRKTGITVCGRGPITAFLRFAARRLAGEVASYYTSLDVTGDFEHSVSYAAVRFHPRSGAAR
jgi:AmmeMemoRadiSam system protein B